RSDAESEAQHDSRGEDGRTTELSDGEHEIAVHCAEPLACMNLRFAALRGGVQARQRGVEVVEPGARLRLCLGGREAGRDQVVRRQSNMRGDLVPNVDLDLARIFGA